MLCCSRCINPFSTQKCFFSIPMAHKFNQCNFSTETVAHEIMADPKIYYTNPKLASSFMNEFRLEVKDILITKSSHQKVSDEVNVNMENSFFEIGRMKVEHVDDIKYDFFAVKNNYISITPITINLTNNNYFDF